MSNPFQNAIDFGTTLNLPTRDEVMPGSRRLDGCYVSEDFGEGTFVPPKWFLNSPPLWRIDVLQDLMHDFEIVRRRAIVEWAKSLADAHPLVDEADHLLSFRKIGEQLGIHLPENLEALLVGGRTRTTGARCCGSIGCYSYQSSCVNKTLHKEPRARAAQDSLPDELRRI